MFRCLTTVAALLAMSPYQAGIVKWREQKQTELKADGGWLTVTGLFWLKEGENRVEGAPGVFVLHEGKARFGLIPARSQRWDRTPPSRREI